jgi:hypothetical protein
MKNFILALLGILIIVFCVILIENTTLLILTQCFGAVLFGWNAREAYKFLGIKNYLLVNWVKKQQMKW